MAPASNAVQMSYSPSGCSVSHTSISSPAAVRAITRNTSSLIACSSRGPGPVSAACTSAACRP